MYVFVHLFFLNGQYGKKLVYDFNDSLVIYEMNYNLLIMVVIVNPQV